MTKNYTFTKLLILIAFFALGPTNKSLAAAVPVGDVHYILACQDSEKTKLSELINSYGEQFNISLGFEAGRQRQIHVSLNAENISGHLANIGLEHIVILATGNNSLAVFEAIKKHNGTIHSLILIDPVVVERSALHPFGKPLDIPYAKITNCVYNFYSEISAGLTRKIKSWYDNTKLKGINIKCEYISLLGRRGPINFSRIISNTTQDKDVIPLAGSLSKIPDVVTIIKNNYRVENDLICLLFSRNEPILSNQTCPLVFINKYSQIVNNKLQTNVYSDTFYDASDILSLETVGRITEQKNQEHRYSTNIQSPYEDLTKRLSLLKRSIPNFWNAWNGINETYKRSFEHSNPPPPNPEEPARVRTGYTPSDQEKICIQKRESIVRKCLNIVQDTPCPHIAVVASGGGVRAMLSTLGALQGLEQSNLLDAITYVCGLSGSTWAIGPWISSGRDIRSISDALINQIKVDHMVNPSELTSKSWGVLATLAAPYYYKQSHNLPYTTVDLYGGYLLQYLMPENLRFTYLSHQSAGVQEGALPFPIYTAIRADGKTNDLVILENRWYEFTPYEIGASWLGKSPAGVSRPTGMYIPSWALGRNFSGGNSTNRVCEQPLALNLAIFGSAFALNVGRAYSELSKNKGSILEWLSKPLLLVDEQRQITAAAYKNFTFGMPTSEIAAQENMQMVDAGLAFNLPYPPVSGEYGNRKADILIFVDASADQENKKGNALIKAAQYAQSHALPFPDLNTDERNPEDENLARLPYAPFRDRIDTAFRIFMSDNKDAPLVIYIRFAKDARDRETPADFVETCFQNHCNTLNFVYPVSTARTVINMMKNNVFLNRDYIRKAILHYHRTRRNGPN